MILRIFDIIKVSQLLYVEVVALMRKAVQEKETQAFPEIVERN